MSIGFYEGHLLGRTNFHFLSLEFKIGVKIALEIFIEPVIPIF